MKGRGEEEKEGGGRYEKEEGGEMWKDKAAQVQPTMPKGKIKRIVEINRCDKETSI